MRAANVVRAGVLVMMAMACPGAALAQDSGYALQFDGVSDLVRLHPTVSMLGPGWTSAKTVSVWVNPLGTPVCTGNNPAACDVIFGDQPRTWGISRGVLGGEDRIWVWSYDGASFHRIGISYVPGQWIQVAMAHGGGALRAYRNGALAGSVATGPTVQGSGQVLHIGGIIANAQRNWTFEGEIDEVQVWSVTRSDAQIAADAGRLLAGDEPGLAAYYRMSNGQGLSLTDDSGRGWTGTLVDGGTGVPADGPITWVPSGALGGGTIVVNQAPVADPQALVTPEDVAVAVVLSGSDPDGDPLTYHVVTAPTSGTLSGSAPNLTYSPAPDFHGQDSFSFVVFDGRAYSSPATVSLTVTPVNDPPVASSDAAVTGPDTPATINVLDNDTDVDGDALTIVHVGPPANGSVVNHGSYLVYSPAEGFTGIDVFGYTISDGQGGFASAEVTVTVREGADPGYALRFDGVSDFVTLGHTTHMLAPGWQTSKTVSLWVRPTGAASCTLPTPTACDAIFGDRPRWWGISRGVINGLDRIWVWNWDGQLQTVPIPYVPGEWLHVALVHQEGRLYAYRNGVLVGSVASGPTQQPNVPTALPVLHIGGIINNAERNWTFQGDIDEVQLWSLARTPEEIAQDMAQPLTGWQPGLSAYYRMSNGAGLLLTDDSGQGWNGRLNDGAAGVPADGPIQWVTSGAFSVAAGR